MTSRPPNKPLPSSPSTPPLDPSLQRQKLARLAWIRVALGAVAGLAAGFGGFVTTEINVVNPNAYYGAYIGVIVYIASFYLAKYNLVKGIAPKDRNKLFTQGLGSYVIMFIFTWIIGSTYHACVTFVSCTL